MENWKEETRLVLALTALRGPVLSMIASLVTNSQSVLDIFWPMNFEPVFLGFKDFPKSVT